MKKTLLVLLLVLFSISVVLASGSQEDADADEQVTVQYGFWGNPDAIGVEQDIIQAFEAENPNIVVEPVVSGYGEYHTKMLTLFAGGKAPDVMRIDSYFFQDFQKLNAFRAIDDLVARDGVDMSAYYQQGVEENTYEGSLYGLPWATAAIYMLINLDVMEDAGIELPELDWTVDDFIEIVKAFEGTEGVYGYATEMSNMASLFPFIWANGGDVFSDDLSKFTMNSPEATEAMQAIADLYQAGLLPTDSVSADNEMMTRWFVNNKIAMRRGSAADILTLQKVEGVRFEAWPMPGGVSKETTEFKSNVIGLNSKTENLEAAWSFLKFLRSPGGQGETLYMEAKRMPPTIDDQKYWSIYADPTKYPKMIEQHSRIIAAEHGHKLPIRPGWLEIQQLITPAYQQLFLGDLSAQEAMDAIAKDAQAVLDRTSK